MSEAKDGEIPHAPGIYATHHGITSAPLTDVDVTKIMPTCHLKIHIYYQDCQGSHGL